MNCVGALTEKKQDELTHLLQAKGHCSAFWTLIIRLGFVSLRHSIVANVDPGMNVLVP